MALMESIECVHFDAKPAHKDFSKHLRVYALSTCAFCEDAIAFLKEEGLPFEYVFIDDLGTEIKRGLKLEIKAKFGQISVFPLLVIDHTTPISGYNHEKWVKLLEL